MRRSLWVSLIIYVLVAFGALAATIIIGNSPHLGLDLQGGTSVVLQPKGKVQGGTLDQSIEIIRSHVDALGVAEPEIQRQGNSIIIELPGVKNQQRALQIVGQTAQLLFRPVLQTLPPTGEPASTPSEQDDPKATVVLPELDKGKVVRRYQLGPAELTGHRVGRSPRSTRPAAGRLPSRPLARAPRSGTTSPSATTRSRSPSTSTGW